MNIIIKKTKFVNYLLEDQDDKDDLFNSVKNALKKTGTFSIDIDDEYQNIDHIPDYIIENLSEIPPSRLEEGELCPDPDDIVNWI